MTLCVMLPLLCPAGELQDFQSEAKERFGETGAKAAAFLVEGMPAGDRTTLKKEFLMENLELALKARAEFPWAKELPEGVFFNDVLPYASLDETRESWRAEFLEQCRPLVKDCKTTTDAVQAINREFFKIINVHYNTGRKAPNQSPSESKKLGMATCTGLSIILVDACRSVGVPARVAGTALWSNKRGNHTWVEIYDGGEWYYTGADEFDAKGLNRGWFTNDASKAIGHKWEHAIWATSWKKTENHFPMVWAMKNQNVPAVNVTARYTAKVASSDGLLYLRVWDRKGGARIVATLNDGIKTKAGTADLNDMATLKAKAGEIVRVTYDGETREVKLPEGKTIDLYWSELK
ncbi:transglutaminase-like domain-containing protein [Verrucomicrobiaceae bacterium 227]